jgi:hypothetical protein
VMMNKIELNRQLIELIITDKMNSQLFSRNFQFSMKETLFIEVFPLKKKTESQCT